MNKLKVYFATQAPSANWGQPSEFELLNADEARALADFGEEMWVLIANPSTEGYQLQVLLTLTEDDGSVLGLSLAAAAAIIAVLNF